MNKRPLFRRVVLNPELSGALYLHSMPGRFEALDSFLEQADSLQVDLVVNLAARDEISKLAPQYAQSIQTGSFPIDRISFTIDDYSVPSDASQFLEFLGGLAHSIQSGQNVLIHCAAGVGRTGLAAAGVLMQLGYPLSEAISAVDEAGCEPEIGEQGAFLLQMAALAGNNTEIS